MKILAVSGDLFEVDISSIKAEPIREINPTEPVTIRQGNTVHLAVSGTLFLSGSLELVKTKGSVEFESKALASLEHWPVHLRRGIDLNYSAVRAATDDVRFLLLASALEILAWKKLGSQETLLKSVLPPNAYKTFRDKFSEFLKLWSLTGDSIERLSNRLLTTSKDSVARHLIDYLQSTGIDGYEVSEAADWWRVRSKIAHGESTSDEELQQVLVRITQAVQNALKAELDVI